MRFRKLRSATTLVGAARTVCPPLSLRELAEVWAVLPGDRVGNSVTALGNASVSPKVRSGFGRKL